MTTEGQGGDGRRRRLRRWVGRRLRGLAGALRPGLDEGVDASVPASDPVPPAQPMTAPATPVAPERSEPIPSPDRLRPPVPIRARTPVREVAIDPEDVQIDPHQLLDRLGVGWEVVLLDVRETDELRRTGQAAGARHVPMHQLDAVGPGLDPSVTVVAYCETGARSTAAALRLRALGHPDAWSLVDGLSGWRRDGGEVVPWSPA